MDYKLTKVKWLEIAEFLEFNDTKDIFYKLKGNEAHFELTEYSHLPVFKLSKIEWFIKEEY